MSAFTVTMQHYGFATVEFTGCPPDETDPTECCPTRTPPHARGPLGRARLLTAARRLTPACAGTTLYVNERAPRRARSCTKVPDMFAQTTQNWWWTAHPAAH
ncbi:trp operon leader peptide [Streptomyces albireticuli]